MPVCEFFGCLSGSRKKGLPNYPKPYLHRFPKDAELRILWQNQILQGHQNLRQINFNSGKFKLLCIS